MNSFQNFVAMHVCRATDELSTCCKVDLTFVENATVINSKRYLIQPPGNIYNPIWPYGITPDMTRDKPSFTDLFSDIYNDINSKLLVVYNANNQMSTFRRTVDHYNLTIPDCQFICARSVGLKTIRDMVDFSFESAASRFGNGKDNSEAVAEIFLHELSILQQTGMDNLPVILGHIAPGVWKPCNTKRDYSKKVNLDKLDYTPDPTKFNIESYFYDKTVCITLTMEKQRKDIAKMIMDIGGHFRDTLTNEVDILVIGEAKETEKTKSTGKIEKVQKKRLTGDDIEVMFEHSFWEIINDEK